MEPPVSPIADVVLYSNFVSTQGNMLCNMTASLSTAILATRNGKDCYRVHPVDNHLAPSLREQEHAYSRIKHPDVCSFRAIEYLFLKGVEVGNIPYKQGPNGETDRKSVV